MVSEFALTSAYHRSTRHPRLDAPRPMNEIMGATMTHPLTRRRLLQAGLAGLPLLAACSDDSRAPAPAEDHGAAVTGEATAVPSSATATAAEAPAATPAPVAQAEPAPAGPKVRTIVLDPGHGG